MFLWSGPVRDAVVHGFDPLQRVGLALGDPP